MTAIAYRDGFMAADSADFSANIIVSRQVRKIVRRRDGALIGASGEVSQCEALLDIFLNQSWREFQPTKDKDNPYAAIVVEPDGQVYRVTENGWYKQYPAPFYTEGSGYEILTGAMAAGASAEQAVRIAIEWHRSCGGEVHVERLGTTEPFSSARY